MNKTIAFVVAIVLVGGVSFYVGTRYAQGKVSASGRGGFANLSPEERQARPSQSGGEGRGFGGMRNGGGFTAGDVIAGDEKSITLRLRDGGSKIVFFTSSTSVLKSVNGSTQDLGMGEQVAVTGTANPDGSINAQSVQIRSTLTHHQ